MFIQDPNQILPNTRKNEGITYVKPVVDQRVKEKLSIAPKHTKMTSIFSIIYCKKEPRTNSHKLTHIDDKPTQKKRQPNIIINQTTDDIVK